MTNDVVPMRGSLRSRSAAAVSAMTLRPLTGALNPQRAWGLWLSRRILAGVMDTFGPPLAGTRVEPVNTVLHDGRRVVGEWVYGARTVRTHDRGPDTGQGRAIYYVHGSGYALCSPRTHRRLTSWLSSLTGLPVFSIDYRLAPRYRFPTAADDVRAGWDWLVDTWGVPPEQVVIAGDSAGGHLTVDMLLQHDVAAKPPAALVLFSPLIDLTFALSTASERTNPDPAIRAAAAARLVSLYHAGIDPGHHRLRLDVAGGPPLPPTLIQAGGAEMLRGDARQLAADIQTAGGTCELQVWPHQVHVFQALPRMTPEAAKAMAYVAQFVRAATMRDALAEEVG
jgi:monoterpene epsilon-lactone hydrolase